MEGSTAGLDWSTTAPADAARPVTAVVRDAGLELIEAQGGERHALERFIAARFAAVYQAQVRRFLPRLFGLHRAGDGERIAAFGLRSAGETPLFLEQYLDEPVEQLVHRHFGVRARRSQIAEVGNLAGATAGALRDLIPELTRLLHQQGVRWVAFTGSARLCNGFSRLGLPLSVVAPARIERLPDAERAHWGSYYALEPSVMLGDVGAGYRILNATLRRPGLLDRQLAPVAGVGAP